MTIDNLNHHALAEQTSLVHWLADEGLITEEAGYDPNVSEWWAVTDVLGDKLEKAGEPVIRAGLEIWGGMRGELGEALSRL